MYNLKEASFIRGKMSAKRKIYVTISKKSPRFFCIKKSITSKMQVNALKQITISASKCAKTARYIDKWMT